MRLAIATDHRGRDLKYEIISILEKDFEMIDCSKENFDTDDYPDFAFKACESVLNKEADAGILICGTGIGMSIAANKVKGIRCALVSDIETARLAKEHNDANVIAFSSKLGAQAICECVREYARSMFTYGNHERRVNKIKLYEEGKYDEL